MNLERISDVLQNYTGQEDSMHAVTDVLQEELGENWTETVFDDLQSLSPALKDNLTHAFNYYAATMAWNELQEYLADENLQDTPELEGRLPILKHWLDFFGAPGQEAYQTLENRLKNQSETTQEVADVSSTTSGEPETVTETEPEPQAATEESNTDVDLNASAEQVLQQAKEMVANEPMVGEDSQEVTEEAPEEEPPEMFEIVKLKKQLDLLDQNQAWLAARCIQLKDIEIYAYPFYGYIVDMLRQVLKNMETIEADEKMVALLDTAFDGGKEAFDNKKQAVQHDIELAEQNCESATTALISEDMDMDEVKRTLGSIDESDTVEYVGPAPDGFELLDDETPLDESAIKKQYEKIEKMDAMTGTVPENKPAEPVAQENTSQNDQKGVQRKLSFSLKRKKPTGDAS